MKKALCLLLCAMLLCLVGCSREDSAQSTTTAAVGSSAISASAADSQPTEFEVTDNIEISIRDYGVIKAELYGKTAPITVANFKKLIEQKYYDGLSFHRIINGFMMQGGNPASVGSTKTAEKITGEFSENGITNDILHLPGVLSMARTANDTNSASGQFFIMHKAAAYLNGSYAAFGCVTSGMDIVDKICTETPVADSNGTVLLQNQPIIEYIRLV